MEFEATAIGKQIERASHGYFVLIDLQVIDSLACSFDCFPRKRKIALPFNDTQRGSFIVDEFYEGFDAS